MSQIISFCGMEKGDFVYYLAVILAHAGKNVAVVDNSVTHDIYNAVSMDAGADVPFVVKQNITYIKNKNITENQKNSETYDYYIVWHGLRIKNEILEISDYSYMMPDYTPVQLKYFGDKIKDKINLNGIIMRDTIVNSKVSSVLAYNYLGIDETQVKGIINFDEKDYENYMAFLYNGRQTFSNLSPNFNDCLKLVANEILEMEPKQFKKLFDKSKNTK